ncbi:MAG: DUF721 domain-containing protein [Pseudomonadota bacterium]
MAERAGYRKNGTTRGFKSASGLLQTRIRTASQSRGFAETRLLTHWAEIVGPDTAAQAHPVKVGYGRGGMGATLTILTTGAVAPMIEMQKEQIRERVNTCYGYTAISRVVITQTAPTGFSEGQVQFTPAPKAKMGITPQARAQAAQMAGSVQDDGLKQAIETLAGNVLSKAKQ